MTVPRISLWPFLFLAFSSCSPLRTSPHDEKHLWELTIHEVQTNLDDLHHDINRFQAELQILDGRMKHYENALASLKQQGIEKQQAKIDLVAQQFHSLEKKWLAFEKMQETEKEEWGHLMIHAQETRASLVQFKERIEELEKELLSQNRRFEELAKVKGNIESIAKALKAESYKIYKVKPGDSLEKISKENNKISVERLKKCNDLEQDLIVVGQELKIPTD